MSRRDNADLRCPRCRMLGDLCVCALIPSPPLETRTRLLLLVHYREERKPTNTGRLAAECLAGSRIVVRGRPGQPTPPFVPDPAAPPLLLFPGEDARVLEPASGPVTLIVPDGNWRQASKMRHRVAGLKEVPCVRLPDGPPSSYRLRHEPVAGGLATMEAIARALAILDGPEVAAALERVFKAMVERTLWARGAIGRDEVS